MGEEVAAASLPADRCVVHLFGHARLEIGGVEIVVRGPIKRGLLAMLALDLGRSVHADRLVDGLWNEGAEGDVVQSLRVHISQLRTFLDGEAPGSRQYIEGRYPLYRLSHQVTTDFARAAALRDRALDRLAHDPEAALRDLDAARRLVSDDPLAEVLHLPFAHFAVDPLRAFQLQLADDYAEVATATWGPGEAEGATEETGRATSMDERRWRLVTRLVDAPPALAAAGGPATPPEPNRLRGPSTSRASGAECGPATLPRDLVARAPAVFIGRQRERAILLDLHASVARDRHTRVVQIVGPGGIGKTALAATVARDLVEAGTAVRYASWSGPALAAHLPFVTAGLVTQPEHDQPQSNPPLGQEALAGEIIDRLRELDDCGVALILDDVDRLPSRYHSVIARLSECPDLAALVVLLHRPGPMDRALEDVLAPDARRIGLRPFSEGELDELSEALGEASAPAPGRHLPWVAGLLLAVPGDEKTDRIRDAVEQIATADRELVERLALAPGGLMLRTLQHGSGFAPVETLDRLRALVADGVVTELDGRPPRFVIAHDLIGEAVRRRAGPATGIERHAALHDALEATDAPLGERVQHAIAGADLLGDRADATMTAAAKLMVRTGAFVDAIALAEATHEAGVARTTPSRIVIEAGRTFAQAALGERTDAARRLLDLAQDAAAIEEWDIVATLMQWRARFGVADPRVGTLLESALAAVDVAEPRLRFEILWVLVFQTMFVNGRIVEASRLVDEMVGIANELRDPSMQVRALACSHWLQAVVGASTERLEALSDAIAEYAEETNDEQLIAGAHAGRVGNALRCHDLAGVDHHADVLRRARDPHTRWRSLLIDVMLQLDHLDLDGAEVTIGNASAFARERGLIIRGDESVAQAFVLSWARGTLDQFRTLLEVRDPASPGYVGWTAALALARLASGDDAGAVELGNELAGTVHAISDWDWYAFIAAALLSDVAFFTGSPGIARHVIEQLTPMSGRRVMLGLAVDLGPVDRYLALAHATLGAHDETRRLRDRARSQAGCELWTRRIERDERATGRIVPETDEAWIWIEG